MSQTQAKWRVGSKVPRNLYRGDEPIAMLADAETAKEIAEVMNERDRLTERERRLREALAALFKKHNPICDMRENVLGACVCDACIGAQSALDEGE